MKRVWEFLSHASQSRTTALLVILVIAAAIPLTVLVAQKQQNIQQKAAGTIVDCSRLGQTYCIGTSNCTTIQDSNNVGSCLQYCDANASQCGGGSSSNTNPTPTSNPTPTTGSTCYSRFACRDSSTLCLVAPPSCSVTDPADTCTTCSAGYSCGANPSGNGDTCLPTTTIPPVSSPPSPTVTVPISPTITVSPSPTTGSCKLAQCGAQQGLSCTCSANGDSCDSAIAAIASTPSCTSKVTSVYKCMGYPQATASSLASQLCQASANSSGNITFSIGLDGVGSVGDRINPGASSASTKNPTISPQFTMEIVNANKAVVATGTSAGTYNSSSGLFSGSSTLTIPAGTYDIYIKAPGHLRKKVGSTNGQTTGLNVTGNLIAGDLNGDDKVDVLDYNIFMSCSVFSTDNHAACGSNLQAADFNGDGTVDQLDYNLLLREFGAQGD